MYAGLVPQSSPKKKPKYNTNFIQRNEDYATISEQS